MELEANIPQRIRLPYYLATSHLSKWPSDLKINGTKETVPFPGLVFHGLSCGVFLFVGSVSFKTPLWMAGIFQQPIRCFYFMVSVANTRINKEDTTWKAMKSWARKCYIFLCTINFEVTWPFWKMWPPNRFRQLDGSTNHISKVQDAELKLEVAKRFSISVH